MKNWKINSWRNYPVKHIPEYPNEKELDRVLGKIKNFPPLVFAKELLIKMEVSHHWYFQPQ